MGPFAHLHIFFLSYHQQTASHLPRRELAHSAAYSNCKMQKNLCLSFCSSVSRDNQSCSSTCLLTGGDLSFKVGIHLLTIHTPLLKGRRTYCVPSTRGKLPYFSYKSMVVCCICNPWLTCTLRSETLNTGNPYSPILSCQHNRRLAVCNSGAFLCQSRKTKAPCSALCRSALSSAQASTSA